jgi:hypothetical protein
MALLAFWLPTDKEGETIMQGTTKGTQPADRPQPAPGPGTPATTTVQAVRKDVTVRLSLASPPTPDAEELKEDGYGHGV